MGKDTYRIANFLGLAISSGHSAKHRMNRTAAPMFKPPKTRRRSQRLTRIDVS